MAEKSNPNPDPEPAREDDLETIVDARSTIPLGPNLAEPTTSVPVSRSSKIIAPVLSTPSLSAAAVAALGQRYDILGDAGHGAMGNVYKARDRETGEIVALKLLKPEIASDQEMMERFKNELLFARRITHKNVCRVYEFNRVGGIAYTSMEFVEGESLRSVLNRFGALSPRKGAHLALQICSGLKEAHAQGIVHRDLKPENVMIDTRGNVKVMDFGIARSMEAMTHLTGVMIGTPAYMAPEQVEGNAVDYRTDVYALGLILYEVFTGTQAFRADNAVAVALKQMRETPPTPSTIEPTIPSTIERAIMKCIEKDPEKRFQTMAELESALCLPDAMAVAPVESSTPSGAAAVKAESSAHSSPQKYESRSKRISTPIWILVAAVVLVAGIAGRHWLATARSIQEIPQPSQSATSTPSTPGAGGIVSPSPVTGSNANTLVPSGISKPRPSGGIAPAAPAPRIAPTAPAVTAPPPVEPSAAKSSSTKNDPPSTPAGPDSRVQGQNAVGLSATPPSEHTPYLLVARYQREDRAQTAAKKIEGLGLPALVLPREAPNDSNVFVVVSGPFVPKKLKEALAQLQAAGFTSIRTVKYSFVNQGATP